MILTNNEGLNRFNTLCEFISNNYDGYEEYGEKVMFTINLDKLRVSLINNYPYRTIYLYQVFDNSLNFVSMLCCKYNRLLNSDKKFFKVYDELIGEI